MAFKLADLFVQFSAKGIDAVTGQVGATNVALQALSGNFVAAGAAAANVVGNMAAAGLQGTAEAERMNLAYQRLNRTIASMFLPIIDRVMAAIDGLTAWVDSMSGTWDVFVDALATVWDVLSKGVELFGRLFELVARLSSGVLGLAAAFLKIGAGALFIVLQSLVWVLDLLNSGLEKIQNAWNWMAGNEKKDHRKVTPSGGGFEGATDISKRIQTAVLKTEPDRNYQKEIADNTGLANLQLTNVVLASQSIDRKTQPAIVD